MRGENLRTEELGEPVFLLFNQLRSTENGLRGTVARWVTEKYYEEFHERKGSLFYDTQAVDVYTQTQVLQQRWPGCIGNPPPEIGSKHGLFYVKNDWPGCTLRICFGACTENGVAKIVALTCRAKQELSKGSSGGTAEWYKHMGTVGIDRWDDYRRGLLKTWRIYP